VELGGSHKGSALEAATTEGTCKCSCARSSGDGLIGAMGRD
jgi:hypothetical protein